ncbi:peptide-binding protein [Acidobacteria bacterium AH-259-D05]|nr:peptide-binding protein [Acidobacteria bacterium AH-259-D05]
MKNVIWIASLALLCSALSCTQTSAPEGSSSDSTAGRVVIHEAPEDHGRSEEPNLEYQAKWNEFYHQPHDQGDTLVLGIIGDVDSLNPLTLTTLGAQDIIGLLFLGLTRTNPDFSHGPLLAKSWEFSDDHLELTFHLRDDVFWHDGVKTTAHDVKFTFEKQRNPNIGWSAIKWKQYIKDCVVIDDYTVKFIFERVYPYQMMDAVVGAILPKHILEKVPDQEMVSTDFNRNPVGNGPFRFKEWKAQQYIEVEANENFVAGRPPLDRIIFKVVPDQENLVIQLRSGQIDFMERVPPRFYKELSRREDLVAHIYPSRRYSYIGWNLRNPLFQSKKVRQALTMAINRQEIIDSLLLEFGEINNGPILAIIWAHNPNLPNSPYDPEKARQYLAEEGWRDRDGDGWLEKDGKRFSFTLKTNKGNQIREDIVVLVQDMLKQVGIEVKPNILEWTIFSGDLNDKNFEAAVAGWSVGLKMDMTTIWHSDSISDKFNFVSYSNPEFDRLNDTAIFEMDQQKAKQMWWRAQEMIAEDQPYTFLYNAQQISFLHKRFQNVQFETVGWSYNLEQWWVPKEQQKY